MTPAVCTEILKLPPVDHDEVFRYAGVQKAGPELEDLLKGSLAEAAALLTGKVCWTELPLIRSEGLRRGELQGDDLLLAAQRRHQAKKAYMEEKE